jgi:hypothetical protein
MNKDLYRAAVNDIKADEKIVKEIAVKMNEKSKVSRKIRRLGVVAASVAVLFIAGVFVNNKLGLNTTSTANESSSIYINKIEDLKPSAKLFIPEGAQTKEYTIDKLSEVFGRNPIPAMPKDFKPVADSTNIIFDAQGKMLFMSSISYSKDINNPEAPSIDIKLNKNALPPKDCLYNSDTVKESVVGSTKVLIGTMTMENKSDFYSAEFIYKEIGYNITAARIEKEVFLDFIKSIIK